MYANWVRDVVWALNLGLPKSTIASASQEGTVVIWTVAKEGDQWEGKVLNDFKTPVWRVSWSLTRNILAVADGNNNVTLWKEVVDGEWQQLLTQVCLALSALVIHAVEHKKPIKQLFFSLDRLRTQDNGNIVVLEMLTVLPEEVIKDQNTDCNISSNRRCQYGREV
ncbi:protein transport protein SEC13 homolog B-like [Magnolia sinica]|uniref:protein transport protein SEC13 homolog B-like n=1 Tax=Magnolia sinica TaxID=86752 RepID=UPI002659F880|nr:protein transport protein SEC13 homolog B-like [Magnolia sinica]